MVLKIQKNVDLCVINPVERVKILCVRVYDLFQLDDDGVEFVLDSCDFIVGGNRRHNLCGVIPWKFGVFWYKMTISFMD